jgi:tRNA-(ms[2]io[6]A)-hydroxylase
MPPNPDQNDAPAPKRRLPVLNQKEPQPEAEERPPWHWVPLGSFATFLLWLPMSALVEPLTKRGAGEDGGAAAGAQVVIGHALAFFLAAFGAGVLVGRVGARAERKHAALGGALAAVLAWLIAAGQGTPGGAIVWGALLAILALLGTGAALLGGITGIRWRRRGEAPAK